MEIQKSRKEKDYGFNNSLLFIEKLVEVLVWQDKKIQKTVAGSADETQKAVLKCLEDLNSEILDSTLKQTFDRFEAEAKARYWQMVSTRGLKWLLVITIILLILTIWALIG